MGIALKKTSSEGSTFKIECDELVEVNDFVCIRPDNIADKALATDEARMPAIGIVSSISGSIATITEIKTLETNDLTVVAEKPFFISETEAGKLQDNAPEGDDKFSQFVAYGLTNGMIRVLVNRTNMVVRT